MKHTTNNSLVDKLKNTAGAVAFSLAALVPMYGCNQRHYAGPTNAQIENAYSDEENRNDLREIYSNTDKYLIRRYGKEAEKELKKFDVENIDKKKKRLINAHYPWIDFENLSKPDKILIIEYLVDSVMPVSR